MNVPYLNLSTVHEPLRNELRETFDEVLNAEWFVQGDYCKKFEINFAKYCGTDYAVGVGNGLDAIRLILLAFGIGPGDEVIVPANTFIATVLAITYVGATPVLVDANKETYNIDISKVEEKITSKTKALIVVHLYGRMAEVERAREIADKYGLYLIEDAAQAHGAEVKGKKAGAWGDAAAFSFYPGKNLGALGDGGAITTNDKLVAERVRALGNYGSTEKYVHEYPGGNSRLDEMQAAFLNVKLAYLEQWNYERRMVALQYDKRINNPFVILPKKVSAEYEKDNVYHIYPILCDYRDQLRDFLKIQGIETGIHYPIPIPAQNVYKAMSWNVNDYPITKEICSKELSLPIYPGMKSEEVDEVINAINSFRY